MDDNAWKNWSERQNAELRDAIRSSVRSLHSGQGGGSGPWGAAVALGLIAILLGLLFVLALPIIYPSFLVGQFVADAVHPLIGILVGLGVFAACLATLYFSRLARAIYAFPFAFAVQLGIFFVVSSSSDLVWASGASLLAGLLLYRVAFAVCAGDDDDGARAWLISCALSAASLAANFLVTTFGPDILVMWRTLL